MLIQANGSWTAVGRVLAQSYSLAGMGGDRSVPGPGEVDDWHFLVLQAPWTVALSLADGVSLPSNRVETWRRSRDHTGVKRRCGTGSLPIGRRTRPQGDDRPPL